MPFFRQKSFKSDDEQQFATMRSNATKAIVALSSKTLRGKSLVENRKALAETLEQLDKQANLARLDRNQGLVRRITAFSNEVRQQLQLSKIPITGIQTLSQIVRVSPEESTVRENLGAITENQNEIYHDIVSPQFNTEETKARIKDLAQDSKIRLELAIKRVETKKRCEKADDGKSDAVITRNFSNQIDAIRKDIGTLETEIQKHPQSDFSIRGHLVTLKAALKVKESQIDQSFSIYGARAMSADLNDLKNVVAQLESKLLHDERIGNLMAAQAAQLRQLEQIRDTLLVTNKDTHLKLTVKGQSADRNNLDGWIEVTGRRGLGLNPTFMRANADATLKFILNTLKGAAINPELHSACKEVIDLLDQNKWATSFMKDPANKSLWEAFTITQKIVDDKFTETSIKSARGVVDQALDQNGRVIVKQLSNGQSIFEFVPVKQMKDKDQANPLFTKPFVAAQSREAVQAFYHLGQQAVIHDQKSLDEVRSLIKLVESTPWAQAALEEAETRNALENLKKSLDPNAKPSPVTTGAKTYEAQIDSLAAIVSPEPEIDKSGRNSYGELWKSMTAIDEKAAEEAQDTFMSSFRWWMKEACFDGTSTTGNVSTDLCNLFVKEFQNPASTLNDKIAIMHMALKGIAKAQMLRNDMKNPQVRSAFNVLAKLAYDSGSRELRILRRRLIDAIALASTETSKTPNLSAVTADQVKEFEASLGKIARGEMNEKERKIFEQKFAQGIMTESAKAFAAIQPTEFVNQAWGKAKYRHLAPNLMTCIDRFNKLSEFVQMQILNETNPENRQRMMKFFVAVQANLIDPKIASAQHPLDYSTATSISAALNTSAIDKLMAKKQLTKAEKDQLDACTPKKQGNYKIDRANYKTFREAGIPYTPYIGIYLTDMLFTDEGIPSSPKGELNAGKVKKMGEIQSECLYSQQNLSTLTLDGSIDVRPIFASKIPYDDSIAYARYRSLEPKEENKPILPTGKEELEAWNAEINGKIQEYKQKLAGLQEGKIDRNAVKAFMISIFQDIGVKNSAWQDANKKVLKSEVGKQLQSSFESYGQLVAEATALLREAAEQHEMHAQETLENIKLHVENQTQWCQKMIKATNAKLESGQITGEMAQQTKQEIMKRFLQQVDELRKQWDPLDETVRNGPEVSPLKEFFERSKGSKTRIEAI